MNFALLASPQGIVAAWGESKRAAKASENAFYINDFDSSSSQPWVTFTHLERFSSVDNFESFLEKGFLEKLPFVRSWMLSPKNKFEALYSEARGELKKILLCVCDRAERNEASALNHLPRVEGSSFYAFSMEGVGAWGCTPELLLTWNSREVVSMALAGTFSDDKKLSQRHGPEHAYVVDFFREIATHNYLDLALQEEEAHRYGDILHLKTKLTFAKSDFDVDKWIQLLHPTPALGVYPRNSTTMNYLKRSRADLPPYFGAPFGFFSENSFEAWVMIRGVFFDDKKICRPIGVGVTAFSTVDEEWEEIQLKRVAMERLWNR